jgi:hypothetical protein
MLRASMETASATFFFITDQRSSDQTIAVQAERHSLSSSGPIGGLAYRAPRGRVAPRRSRRRLA